MSDDLFSKNYFEIFAVPVAFDIDMTKVSDLYRDLQKQFHPDRFASGSDEQRRLAMQQTSLINQAFQTLKEAISRAQYLLKLQGMDMDSETDTSMDAAFLMEQMEIREAIAEVRNQTDPLETLDKLSAELKQKLTQLTAEFAQHYADSSLVQARESIRKMQFIIKAQIEVKTISEQLEDELL